MNIIGTRIGRTPENTKLTKKVAIKYAYLSPIANKSSLYNLTYACLVGLDVGTLQQRLSHKYFTHFSPKAINISTIGKAILNIRVKMMTPPT